jgi:hypothetical protein
MRRGFVLALLGAVGAFLALAASASSRGPNPVTQAPKDGCQRSPAGLIQSTTAEWVYVNGDRRPRVVEGVVRHAHVSGTDLPGTHAWYDWLTPVKPDPKYANLLAGDPSQRTGNFQGKSDDPSTPDEEYGLLGTEWEIGSVPSYVWATDGDHVKYWGAWIWDCGHFGYNGQTRDSQGLPGEKTEFHPVRAMVVVRHAGFRSKDGDTQADVLISSDGTTAHAVEDCALRFPASSPDSYPPEFTSCYRDPANNRQKVNDRDYTFFLPAPPKPSKDAKLTYSVDRMAGGRAPREEVVKKPTGIEVTIPFKGFGGNSGLLRYAKTIYVGWSQPPKRKPDHLRVTLDNVTVDNSLDPNKNGLGSGDPPGEYQLYLDINGDWTFLNDLNPDLGAVSDGQVVAFDHPFDVYVPHGKGVRLFTGGRECDLPPPQIEPCPVLSEGLGNDDPGEAQASFASARAALGRHTIAPDSANYTATFTIRRLRGS